MEFTNGKMDGSIKEILKMTIEMGMENFLMEINVFTGVSGKMVNKLIIRNQWAKLLPEQVQAFK